MKLVTSEAARLFSSSLYSYNLSKTRQCVGKIRFDVQTYIVHKSMVRRRAAAILVRRSGAASRNSCDRRYRDGWRERTLSRKGGGTTDSDVDGGGESRGRKTAIRIAVAIRTHTYGGEKEARGREENSRRKHARTYALAHLRTYGQPE